jgi:CRP/FNR family transcriptional regulator, cyclic AMP receptor protein
MSIAGSTALSGAEVAANGHMEPPQARVLEAEPGLCDGIELGTLPAATRTVAAATCSLERGRWPSEPWTIDRRGSLGLLVLDGMLARQVLIDEKESVELVGPGDVLRPWAEVDREISEQIGECWIVPRNARLALLDREFAVSVAPWPEIAANVADRVAMRVGRMALISALQGMRRIDLRLLAILWTYADRWGRVTPRGVALDLELTHRLIGGVVGARRPSVTTALKLLIKKGALSKRPDGSWLLHGKRPAILETLEPPRPQGRRDAHTRLRARRAAAGRGGRGGRGGPLQVAR